MAIHNDITFAILLIYCSNPIYSIRRTQPLNIIYRPFFTDENSKLINVVAYNPFIFFLGITKRYYTDF